MSRCSTRRLENSCGTGQWLERSDRGRMGGRGVGKGGGAEGELGSPASAAATKCCSRHPGDRHASAADRKNAFIPIHTNSFELTP